MGRSTEQEPSLSEIRQDRRFTAQEKREIVLASGGRRHGNLGRHANPTDRDAGQAFCRSGGRVVSASAADLRALRVAASPVTAALERNPATRALVARVRALAGTPPAGRRRPHAGRRRRTPPSDPRAATRPRG
jgi:hypothetical protein